MDGRNQEWRTAQPSWGAIILRTNTIMRGADGCLALSIRAFCTTLIGREDGL